MKIVQVSRSQRGGGAERIAWLLHEGYTAAGADAQLIVETNPDDARGVIQLRNGTGLWTLHDRLRHGGRPRLARVVRGLASPATIADAALGREDFRFPSTRDVERLAASADVLQLHNLHGSYFDLRVLPGLTRRVPVVLCPQDMWLVTGHVAHSFECERWRTGCGACPHLRVYPALLRDGTRANWRAKKAIYAGSSLRVAVPCRWLANVVGDSMLAPAVRELRVIPNGVDLQVFNPGDRAEARRHLELPADANLLVFAAQGAGANEFKDYATLVRALPEVASLVESKVTAVALGAAKSAARDVGGVALRDVAAVPAAEVASWLRAADLYVHPTRADTFPLGVLEALACGLPVVASAVGGIPEQLTEKTGILVPPQDARALAGAVAALLTDPARRREMGRAAAEEAAVRFGVDRQVASYLDWFAALGQSNARAARLPSRGC